MTAGRWAGPFTVANEPHTLGDGTKAVQIADSKGEPYAMVFPLHTHGQNWDAATARAKLIAEALNKHGPPYPFEDPDAAAKEAYAAHNREFPRPGMCPWDVLTDTAKQYWRDRERRHKKEPKP